MSIPLLGGCWCARSWLLLGNLVDRFRDNCSQLDEAHRGVRSGSRRTICIFGVVKVVQFFYSFRPTAQRLVALRNSYPRIPHGTSNSDRIPGPPDEAVCRWSPGSLPQL